MRQLRQPEAVIAIVDDDASVQRGLQRLIRSAGWKVETFASAQEFLARSRTELPNCVLLDLQLPGLSGLDLQKRMAEVNIEITVVFITGHGDVPMSVRAIKADRWGFCIPPRR